MITTCKYTVPKVNSVQQHCRLKLAEIELIKQETREAPILLLDDVLSELDDYRQSHLLNTIQGEVQTFVTTTSVDGIHHETIKNAEMFHVKQGTIE